MGGIMCTNYAAARRRIFEKYFPSKAPDVEWKDEIWKDYPAPIIRRGAHDALESILATFGMVPRKRISPGVKVWDTMNARAETVGQKQSFRAAWANAELCLIPAEAVYEPNWETGVAVRWRIGMASGDPFAIAGLWRAWKDAEGESHSFTMLTLNADDHPLMKRFHRPGSEKRSVVILRSDQYGDWLSCRDPEVARSFLRLLPGEEMTAEAAPLPPRNRNSAA
jgi:putative SOS response-associated peptidase YedK